MVQHPDYVVPTGDFIKEWMEDEGINAAELARRLGFDGNGNEIANFNFNLALSVFEFSNVNQRF